MKIVLLKLSGKALSEFTTNHSYIEMMNELKENYDGIIIVHGAGKMITEWSSAMNLASSFVNGHRKTTKDIMDVVSAVQGGLTNSTITSFLHAKGFDATGLNGIDRNLFIADYLDKDLGFVGLPKLNGDITWLKDLIKSGVIPVYSSVCRDVDGNLMNVNADLFAKELAIALSVDTVIFVSDVDAVKIDGLDMSEMTELDVKFGIANGHITDGMIPKLESSVELLNNAVKKVWIGNNPTRLKFKSALLNDMGGTWIVESKRVAI
ncbi:MAG: acetylglutamate kinase [Bacteroidetes bacterium]|nr:acetylglutamate kinase [Bacteroidota bacterium]MBU1113796.1 acetylglutamate kinase [Bacteroidota bacterium]MBU1798292.1 acetylglutamate kinase [Bacteroidota bacterium]